MSLYCPRCDKRLTPDHRCLSRRHFFGMLGAAAAALALPKPVHPITRSAANPLFLRAGDKLTVSLKGSATDIIFAQLEVVRTKKMMMAWEKSGYDVPVGSVFTAPEDCVITGVRYSTATCASNVPVKVVIA